jgi:beta-phosphoglucomutase-like phosphatase (HAD superfamily)
MYHHESEEIYKLLNYDAILFDVDGTLIDSAPGIINTLKEVFARMGVDTTNVNLRRYLGPPLRRALVSTLPTRPSLKRPPTCTATATPSRAATSAPPTPVQQRCCSA